MINLYVLKFYIDVLQVTLVPLEECSMHRNCSSCVSDRNPLCGWCVVENKCSRISQCANGNSTSDRWIRAISTTSSSGRCIMNVINPSQFIMDNPQIERSNRLFQYTFKLSRMTIWFEKQKKKKNYFSVAISLSKRSRTASSPPWRKLLLSFG